MGARIRLGGAPSWWCARAAQRALADLSRTCQLARAPRASGRAISLIMGAPSERYSAIDAATHPMAYLYKYAFKGDVPKPS
mmetsp:Transcript_20836/g.64599  ORF Transcript_20836/g.64599 Transcript_20836/m.64599 type:complete len:81 (-) Transcript_20836:280-522(-)